MRFLVDAQLPPALAKWLSAAGHSAEHVADCGLGAASDREVWSYALREECVVVTKDEDFPSRLLLEGSGPRIVWVRLGNTRRRDLIGWFELKHRELIEALERGESLVELA